MSAVPARRRPRVAATLIGLLASASVTATLVAPAGATPVADPDRPTLDDTAELDSGAESESSAPTAESPSAGPGESPTDGAEPDAAEIADDYLDVSNDGTAIVSEQTATQIAPGAVLTEFTRMESAGWLQGAVLDIDLTNPAISLDYMDSGEVAGTSTISDMIDEADAVAGINGSGFDIGNSGSSNGIGVDPESGIVTSPNPGDNAALVIDSQGLGLITEVFMEGVAAAPDAGWELPLTGVNASEWDTSGVGVFTDRWGTYARANSLPDRANAVEVWIGRDSRVTQVAGPVGEGEIPADARIVVAPAGELADQLSTLAVGDRLQTTYSVRSDADEVVLALGGHGGRNAILLQGGVLHDASDESLAPRTAVGLDEAGEHLYMVVIDGRQDISRGMSLDETGEFMQQIGSYNALNLDGGGSTQMNATDPGETDDEIVNSPSDGEEREDANGIGVIVGPSSGIVHNYSVRPEVRIANAHRVFPGLHRQMVALGYDEVMRAVGTPAESWVSSDEVVATVDTDGLLTAGATGTTTVSASTENEVGTATGEADVEVLGELVRLEASPNVLSLPDPGASTPFTLYGYDAEGFIAPIDAADVTIEGADGVVELTPATASTFDISALVDSGSATLTLSVGDVEADLSVMVGLEELEITSFDEEGGWWHYGSRNPNSSSRMVEEGRTEGDTSAIEATAVFNESTATRTMNFRSEINAFPAPEGQLQTLSAWFRGDGRGTPEIYFSVFDAEGTFRFIYGGTVTGTEWQQLTVQVPQDWPHPIQFGRVALYESSASEQYETTVLIDDVTATMAPIAEAPEVPVWEDPSLSTANAADDAGLRVAVMSDAQFVARAPESPQVANARRGLQEIVAEDPDLLVINGDFTDEAAPEDFDLARRILDEELAETDLPWVYVPGNHEIMGGPISNFEDEFGETHTVRDVAGTRIITLNSATGRLGDDFGQMVMLRQQLLLAQLDPEITGVMVFSHYPPRDFLPGAPSAMADRLEAATLEQWLGEVEDSGRSVMFVGAGVGAFDVSTRDGVEYLTNGNVGKSPNSTPDRGGFSGWSMIGIDPASGMHDTEGEWSQIEIRPLVDSLEIGGGDVVELGGSLDLEGTVVQDERRVPTDWPVSALWSGDGETVVPAGTTELPATAVATIEPATGIVAAAPGRALVDGELVVLTEGETPGYDDGSAAVPVTVTLEVNDSVAEHEVDVHLPVYSSTPALENGFFLDDDWAGLHEHVFRFGRSGDEVFVGDWDADGADT
ncbi:phosphodiester glycosidase family protein, partial [Georgenia sp. Z1344]|uniref:phosphodiester glycosidase family protein n=1 Tax=Georgenia sp. Z1344 TaxID=3416706 RepID=UPI003CEA97D6